MRIKHNSTNKNINFFLHNIFLVPSTNSNITNIHIFNIISACQRLSDRIIQDDTCNII